MPNNGDNKGVVGNDTRAEQTRLQGRCAGVQTTGEVLTVWNNKSEAEITEDPEQNPISPKIKH